jgi:hypothetical protein
LAKAEPTTALRRKLAGEQRTKKATCALAAGAATLLLKVYKREKCLSSSVVTFLIVLRRACKANFAHLPNFGFHFPRVKLDKSECSVFSSKEILSCVKNDFKRI